MIFEQVKNQTIMNNIKNNPVELVYSVNWAAFKLITGNRLVADVAHVDSIAAAMKRGDFIPPIIVDEKTRQVIDGQHRYAAACDLWKLGIEYNLLVMYVDYVNPLLAAIKYNSTSKRWLIEDYVRAYIADGNQSYVILKNFCETHPLLTCKKFGGYKNNYKAAMQILTGNVSGDCIKKGTLVITEDQCNQAEIVYRQLELMIQTTNCTRIISRDNVHAWLEVREFILSKCRMDKFLIGMRKYFVCPNSDSKSEWVKTYLEIANKTK